MGKRLIDEKKKAFGINISISSRTIKNRIQRGSLTTHQGAKSLLEEVEVALVEICIQLGKNLSALIFHQSHHADE